MSLITGLGYVGLGVKDVDAWESFGTQILGLENGGRTDDGRQLLRMDEYEYRFALHHDDADDIAYAGWEVADASGLREIAERLRTIGVEVSAGTTEDTKIRRVTELIKFTDPNGVACEAFYGPWIQFEKPFHSPRPISGFVTGVLGQKPKPGRSDDAARRGLESQRCGRASAAAENLAHLCPTRDEA
jgi:biphenyl-2,3-diol 1,2-dioxygenase